MGWLCKDLCVVSLNDDSSSKISFFLTTISLTVMAGLIIKK